MTGDAFALAGLGGFNAHGAGFLAAARDHAVTPDLITATSGQILVVADWLQGADLKTSLVDPLLARDPLAQLATVIFGDKGIFKPAYQQAFERLWSPPPAKRSLFDDLADRLLPAQAYVTTRTAAFFEETAAALNAPQSFGGPQIGVVFNTYEPRTGEGRLYGNDRARELLTKATSLPPLKAPADGTKLQAAPEAPVLPITAEALRSALWLSLYGFEGMPGGQMDGAYLRSCIVSELHDFDRLFIARPLAQGWRKPDQPRNWFEVQDWQCEMWFSVAYKAELDALMRINQLIEQGYLQSTDFKRVEVHEIEPETPAGYFHYFVERDSVFDAARAQASALFTSLGMPKVG